MTERPSRERLLSLLKYDPGTGVFIWKPRGTPRWDNKNAGRVAGGIGSGGYIRIAINREKWLAHHLAWVIGYGSWPPKFIDHINLDRADNRLDNLRLASPAENSANVSLRSDNTSGFRGVFFEKRRQKWIVLVEKNGKRRQFGSFKDKNDAAKAHAAALIEVHGEFCPLYIRSAA